MSVSASPQVGTLRQRLARSHLFAGCLGALLVGAVTTLSLIAARYRQVGSTNRRHASVLAGRVRGELVQGRELLRELAARLASGPLTAEAMDSVLRDVLTFQPLFLSFYVYDSSGEVVLRRYPEGIHDPSRATEGSAIRDRQDGDFREVAGRLLHEGGEVVLPVRRSARGNPYLSLLVALPGQDGHPVGLLSGAVNAAGEGFDEFIADLAPGPGGYTLLLDGSGQVVSATGRTPAPEGEVLGGTRRTRAGELQLVHAGGVDFLAEEALDEVGLRLVVGIPRDVALESLPGWLLWFVLATLAAAALAAGVGLGLAARLAKPLQALLRGIEDVGAGALSHRVPVEGEGELAQVTRAFNRLAEDLERNHLVEDLWLEEERAAGLAPPEEGGA